MTVEEKVEILRSIFRQLSNHGVERWGPIETGYKWKCDTHATASGLAKMLVSHLALLGLDVSTFPHRFHPEDGPDLIFEPIAD